MKSVFIIFLACFMLTPSLTIHDFTTADALSDWYVVNDGVMGGRSQGTLQINADGHAVFEGFVSLDNYGGFTSIRKRIKPAVVDEFTTVQLRVKGDGKSYQFRAKSDTYDRHSYITYFETTGEWETIQLPLRELYPSFRGRRLNMPDYPGYQLSDISLLIANKKAESFQLIIDKIWLE